MTYPKMDTAFCEQLDVIRYIARDKKSLMGMFPKRVFAETDRDFKRIVKMVRAGKELCPGSYKRITVSHWKYGTDDWSIRISASLSWVTVNKYNWEEFSYWVERYMPFYSPDSAAGLMDMYPHISKPL